MQNNFAPWSYQGQYGEASHILKFLSMKHLMALGHGTSSVFDYIGLVRPEFSLFLIYE